LNWIYRTLSGEPFALAVHYPRDDDASVKDARHARAGFAGASHP